MEPNTTLLKQIMATMQRGKYYLSSIHGRNNKINYNKHMRRGPKNKKNIATNEQEEATPEDVNILHLNNVLLTLRYNNDMKIYNEIIKQIGKTEIIKLGLIFDSLFKFVKKDTNINRMLLLINSYEHNI